MLTILPLTLTDLPAPTTTDVRPATLDDLPSIRRLYASFIVEQPPIYPIFDVTDVDAFTLAMAAALRYDPRHPPFGCFVAVGGARVVGFIAGEVLTRQMGQPRLYATAHWCYLEPAHRGQGLGRALVTAGITWLRALGVGVLEAAANTGHDHWQRWGFQPYLSRFVVEVAAIALAPPPPAVDNGGHPNERLKQL